jgi:hypothetical protein
MLKEDIRRLTIHLRVEQALEHKTSDYKDLILRIGINDGKLNETRLSVKTALATYNIALCRRASELLYKKCPRELRDMVLAYVTMGQVRVFNVSSIATWRQSHPRSAHDPLCSGHFWRDEVVGPTAAMELIESWYRHAIFDVSHLTPRLNGSGSLLHLRFITDHDRFGMGFKPLELLGNIATSFTLILEQFPRLERYHSYKKELDELFVLKHGARIHLRIETPAYV